MLWLTVILYLWTAQTNGALQSFPDLEDETSAFGVPTLLLDSLQLTLSSKLLLDIYSPQSQNLKGYLGWLPVRSNTKYASCSGEESLSESICLKYEKDMKLLVTQDDSDYCEVESLSCDAVTCHKIHWTNHIAGTMDCFIIGDDEWYGGGITLNQRWPIQGDSRPWFPVATGDPIHHPFRNIVENIWMSSSGFVIHVEDKVPLFVSFNESGSGKLCLTTSYKKHPYQIEDSVRPELEYTVCSVSTVKDAYSFSMRKWFKKPTQVPDEMVFQYPIWSTWARYKSDIDQNTTLQFAHEIKLANFPTSQLEIDDKWESCYGNLEFDATKFPDPKAMISDLKSIGFATTLWVHPFCNIKCEFFKVGQGKGFWVKDKEGKPLEVKWWNGDIAGMLDVTNTKAVEWFVERLKNLQSKYGIASFKFDAGEVLWLDRNFVFQDQQSNLQPNIYSKRYAELASRFGGRVEIRTGYRTQHLPVFVRIFDKFSRWDHANGLKTLIPNALQMSVMGYFFILPDMIGGNNYDSNGQLPDRELYVRWLQATVFLPVIQFSITPWDYDDEVVAISKKMVDLHDKYATLMLDLARKATITGEPIIRPLWWISPDDVEALRTDSEFLVGENVLVAPVLEKGKNSRHIYLPDGSGQMYKEERHMRVHDGCTTMMPQSVFYHFLFDIIKYLSHTTYEAGTFQISHGSTNVSEITKFNICCQR